jgi:DsbC/DsbD-like thiol-disulfide interchange protein
MLMLWLLAAAAFLQVRPVTWTATAPKAAVAGTTVVITVVATIDDGWHLYSTTQPPGGPVPTRITVAASPVFGSNGSITFPKPAVAPDPNFGINVETYDRSVTFTVPVKVAANARPGVDTVTIQARFQTCNASLCLPPRTQTVSVPLTVRAGAGPRDSPETKGSAP